MRRIKLLGHFANGVLVSHRDIRLMRAVVRHATMFATGELSLRDDPPVTHAHKLKVAVAAFNAPDKRK